jgi:streptogramin lyase
LIVLVAALTATVAVAAAVALGGSSAAFAASPWSGPTSINDPSVPSAISCTSSSFCAAGDGAGNAATFTGAWGTFALVDSGFQVTSVSCSSSSFCAAVDSHGQAATYNGAAWSAFGSIDGTNHMTSVSCVAGPFCVAVDNQGNEATYTGTWAAAASIDGNGITSVSCASSSFCVAVDGQGGAATFTGTWSAFAAIDGAGGLTSVSCTSSSFCAAVDSHGQGAKYTGTWSAFASVDGGAHITSVSCASGPFCIAVDTAGDAITFDTGVWTDATGPDPGEPLASVSCVSSTFCMALDNAGNAVTWTGPPQPVSTSAPTITGTTQTGQSLTEHQGGWSNGPTTFTVTWEDCDTSGNNCVAGPSGATYPLTAADVGHTVRAKETAMNGGDAGTATSAATAVVTPPPPTTVSAPTITGTDTDGQLLTEHHGQWNNGPISSYALSWKHCNSNGASCVATGATGPTYLLGSTDVGKTIVVTETASNAGGPSAAIPSTATAVIAPPPVPLPQNTTPPTISGTAQQGQTLSEGHGQWANGPINDYALSWEDCDGNGANCSPTGQTGSTYLVTASDLGHTIVVEESATNAGGTSQPTGSAATAVVVAPPVPLPVNSSPPTISGSAQDGGTLTEGHGSWTNSPAGYALTWEDCDATGANCKANGQDGSTYPVGASDIGHTIRVEESAINAGGVSAPTPSAATAVITLGTSLIASRLGADVDETGLKANAKILSGSGSLTLSFTALEAGVADVSWFAGAHAGTRAGVSAASRQLVASGTLRFASASTRPLELRLTKAGRRLLSSHASVSLTAQATFTPTGAAAITATRTLVVRHIPAAGRQTGVFRIPTAHSGATAMVSGPDGDVWFTEWNIGRIAKVSPKGVVTEYPVRIRHAAPWGLTPGPGGIWFTDKGTNAVGVITPTGAATEYPIHTSAKAQPTSIAAGPRGTMRFTETGANAIGTIDLSTHAISVTPLPAGSSAPFNIVSDGAGDDYFDDVGGQNHVLQIGEITSAGRVGNISLRPGSRYGAYPNSIAVGENAAGQRVVYTLDDGNHAIAAYNTTTAATHYYGYPKGAKFAQGLTLASDGTLWYTTQKTGVVDRLSPATGVTVEYATKPATVEPDGIAQAGNGSIWLLDWYLDRVFRLTGAQCTASLCLVEGIKKG